jgi:hypothetical protein
LSSSRFLSLFFLPTFPTHAWMELYVHSLNRLHGMVLKLNLGNLPSPSSLLRFFFVSFLSLSCHVQWPCFLLSLATVVPLCFVLYRGQIAHEWLGGSFRVNTRQLVQGVTEENMTTCEICFFRCCDYKECSIIWCDAV